MNGFFLVGTVFGEPKMTNGPQGTCALMIQSDRMFRNEDGSLDEDYYRVEVWRGISEEVKDCCKDGMIIAVKGRIVSQKKEDGTYECCLIGEHVTYPHRRAIINKKSI